VTRGSLFRFLSFLARIGVGRTAIHVDAAERLHVVVATQDGVSGQQLADVEILLEKPPEGVQTAPSLRMLGRTSAAGAFDETLIVGWSYDVGPAMSRKPPPPMAIVLRKPPYRDTRHHFDLNVLPRIAIGPELSLGAISLLQ